MEATVRNVRIHAVKVKVWTKMGVFEQAFCDVVVSLSSKNKM